MAADDVDEETPPPPAWIEGHRYDRGDRVTFRGAVWVASHRTEVRPNLSKSWTRQ